MMWQCCQHNNCRNLSQNGLTIYNGSLTKQIVVFVDIQTRHIRDVLRKDRLLFYWKQDKYIIEHIKVTSLTPVQGSSDVTKTLVECATLSQTTTLYSGLTHTTQNLPTLSLVILLTYGISFQIYNTNNLYVYKNVNGLLTIL